jgi:hypothetical protein
MNDNNTTIHDLIAEIEENKTIERLCHEYYSFLSKFEESEDQKLIRTILSYHMKPNNAQNPFDAFLILEGRRSSIPEDLSDEEIQKLIDAYQNISDHELKARVADVLWLKKREIKYAHDSITSYTN